MPPRCLALSGTFTKPPSFAQSPQSLARTFTSTAWALAANPLKQRKGGDLGSHLPKYVIPQNIAIPDYPYGPSQLFKQQDKGLYGGKSIHFGNNVSEKTETTTRRYWKPNVLNKALYSVGLKKKIKLRVTSSVIKTIDREGGLDEYLLKQSDSRIKELGPLGWALRWTLLQRPSIIRRMRREAAELGVPQEEIDAQWPAPPSEDMTPEEFEAFDEAALDALEYLEEGPMEEELRAEKQLTTTWFQVSTDATSLYKNITKAAKNYMRHENVYTIEQGIKLAFLRKDERAENSNRNFAQFKARVEEKYGKTFDDRKELRQAIQRYRKEMTNEIAENFAGDRKAYRKAKNPEGAATFEAAVADAGSEALLNAQRREVALKELKDSESGLASEDTPEEERLRIQSALRDAQLLIDAGTKAAYVEQALARWEQSNQDKWPLNKVSVEEGLGEAVEEAAQGWDALAQKESTGEQPRL
jgi:large subunit ribosomal protein L28